MVVGRDARAAHVELLVLRERVRRVGVLLLRRLVAGLRVEGVALRVRVVGRVLLERVVARGRELRLLLLVERVRLRQLLLLRARQIERRRVMRIGAARHLRLSWRCIRWIRTGMGRMMLLAMWLLRVGVVRVRARVGSRRRVAGRLGRAGLLAVLLVEVGASGRARGARVGGHDGGRQSLLLLLLSDARTRVADGLLLEVGVRVLEREVAARGAARRAARLGGGARVGAARLLPESRAPVAEPNLRVLLSGVRCDRLVTRLFVLPASGSLISGARVR